MSVPPLIFRFTGLAVLQIFQQEVTKAKIWPREAQTFSRKMFWLMKELSKVVSTRKIAEIRENTFFDNIAFTRHTEIKGASLKTGKPDRERKTGHSSDYWMVQQCPVFSVFFTINHRSKLNNYYCILFSFQMEFIYTSSSSKKSYIWFI